MPLLIAAFVMLALAKTQLFLTLGMMVQGFGMGLAGPGFMAGASLAVSQKEQGSVAGVAGSCGPLGFTIGPLLGGAMYQISPSLPYAFAAVVYVILLGFMQWIGTRVAEHQAEDDNEIRLGRELAVNGEARAALRSLEQPTK